MFRPSSDAKQLEFYEDRGLKSFKTDVQSVKSKNLDSVLQEPTSDGNFALNHGRAKNNLVGRKRASEASTSGMFGHACSIRIEANEEKAGHQFPAAVKSSPEREDLVAFPLEHKYLRVTPVKEEVSCYAFFNWYHG